MPLFNTQRTQYGLAAPWSANSNATVRTAFIITGIAFVLICGIGLIVASALGGVAALSPANYSRDEVFSDNFSTIRILAIVSLVIIVASSLGSFLWAFKLTTAGPALIGFVFSLYVVGQGIGFGFLFLVLQAKEAAAIFGVGGGIFLAMGAIGYFFKNLGGLWKFIVAGTIAMLICSLVSLILYFTGVYSEVWVMVMIILSGLLFMAYTVFDVWMLRRMAEWSQASGGFKDRIAWFFGFKLLTDLIALIRIVALMFLRFYK